MKEDLQRKAVNIAVAMAADVKFAKNVENVTQQEDICKLECQYVIVKKTKKKNNEKKDTLQGRCNL